MSLPSIRRAASVAVIIPFMSTLTGAHFPPPPQHMEPDSAAVAAVVDRYHRALSDGDTANVLALLANDAVILESGDVETREEYRAHHLRADIEFARAVPSRRGPVRVVMHGDVAWASSTSNTQGTFRGRSVDSQGAELMVISREQGQWKIRAIHWSSHALRPSR